MNRHGFPGRFSNAGYQGVAKLEDIPDICADCHEIMCLCERKVLDKKTCKGRIMDQLQHANARIRANVEQQFWGDQACVWTSEGPRPRAGGGQVNSM